MRMFALLLAPLLIAATVGCNQPAKPEAAPAPTPEMMAATQPTPAIAEPREEPTYRPIPRTVIAPGTVKQPGGTLPPTTTPPGGRTYIVQKGDGLMSIARKLYNDPRRYKDLQALNPDITDPGKLKAGQVIKVPEK